MQLFLQEDFNVQNQPQGGFSHEVGAVLARA